MLPQNFYSDGYERTYIDARLEMDRLCAGIVAGTVTLIEARRRYDEIERQYAAEESEKIDLFRMIYSGRIERLCQQFTSGGE